jgi:hypothetical protein
MIARPVSAIPEGENWRYEPKLDGDHIGDWHLYRCATIDPFVTSARRLFTVFQLAGDRDEFRPAHLESEKAEPSGQGPSSMAAWVNRHLVRRVSAEIPTWAA